MLGAADPELARSAHSWMAEVHWYMLWTSMEPAGGVMNRLRRGRSSDSDSRSSDSDGRSLRIAGPEHHAGPRRSTAPEGSKERVAARARLDRVESRGLRRTGPSRTTIQDVPLEVGHATVPAANCNSVFQVTALTLHVYRAEQDRDRDPIPPDGFHDYI